MNNEINRIFTAFITLILLIIRYRIRTLEIKKKHFQVKIIFLTFCNKNDTKLN